MKKKTIALVLAVILALGAGFVLVGCSNNGSSGTSTAPKGIKDIKTGKQVSGNVTFTNYRVNTTDEINWDSMSKEDKEKIIKYAFTEVYKQNEMNSIRYFNIIGVSPTAEVLFMYDRENNEMVVYKAGQQDYRIAAPAK